MTKDEIMAMEAGPELDALVAEKVMGIRLVESINVPGRKLVRREGAGWVYPPLRYSEDIADAWEVILKMHWLKPIWILVAPNTGRNGGWVAYESTGCADPDFGLCVHGITAPEAICKAALLACMEE